MTTNNTHTHKVGDEIKYLDYNEYPVPQWKDATVTGLDRKDGEPVYIVKLSESGRMAWGKEDQVKAA